MQVMTIRRFAIIVAFLLAQSLALAHDIGHDDRDQIHSCELCHSFCGLDHGISANDHLLSISHDSLGTLVSTEVTAYFFEKYRSSLPRDPPA